MKISVIIANCTKWYRTVRLSIISFYLSTRDCTTIIGHPVYIYMFRVVYSSVELQYN